MKLRMRWPRRANDTSKHPKIAVMGALRSGTNLIAGLLEKYWRVSADFHSYGWKHAGVPILDPTTELKYPDTPIVWISKNPHALIVSMHRYRTTSENGRGISLDGELDFAAFLRAPITIWDSQLPSSPRLRFANPAQYWNFITWNLETLDPARFRAIGFNYEDIVSDPQVLTKVEHLLPLERRNTGPIKLPEARMARGKNRVKSGVEAFDTTVYTSQSYLASFTQDDLAFIAAEVDPWLIRRRGYELP